MHTTTPITTPRRAEAFVAARAGDWMALENLLAQVGSGRLGKLAPEDVARFGALHRALAADLAVARLRFPGSPLVGELNDLVGRAHSVLYAAPLGLWGRGLRFMVAGFPQAVRRSRRFVLATAVFFVAAVVGGWLWYSLAPAGATNALFPGIDLEELNRAGESLQPLSAGPVQSVAITVNNVRVAFVAFALGVLGCVGTGFLLVFNGMLFGGLSAYAFSHGRGVDLLALILPHGVVELSVIVLAAAAGVQVGWAMIAPGRLRRSRALALAGREAVRVLAGTVPWFVLAGLVEGFFTPAGFPPAVNILFGLVLGATFWLYLAYVGRRGEAPHSTERRRRREEARSERRLAEAALAPAGGTPPPPWGA